MFSVQSLGFATSVLSFEDISLDVSSIAFLTVQLDKFRKCGGFPELSMN